LQRTRAVCPAQPPPAQHSSVDGVGSRCDIGRCRSRRFSDHTAQEPAVPPHGHEPATHRSAGICRDLLSLCHFPGEPGLAGFIGAKDDGNDGNNWSYKTSSSRIVTTNKPTPNFIQAGCPSCHPTNSVKALKEARYSRCLQRSKLIITVPMYQ